MPVSVSLRTMTGVVHELADVDTPVQVEQLYLCASQALGLAPERFKLVLRGAALARAADAEQQPQQAAGRSLLSGKPASVRLSAGDVLLVMPQRQAPSEQLQRAAAAAAGVELGDEEDAPLRFRLRPGAPAWEAWLARFLQDRCAVPELALIWVFHIGPARLALLFAVVCGAKLASRYDLGPVYILVAIIIAIFTHLGRKAEGEASAYSVFNPGVRRLPGQLDAVQLDQQIRRGQLR